MVYPDADGEASYPDARGAYQTDRLGFWCDLAGDTGPVSRSSGLPADGHQPRLLRAGYLLEATTLAWNVVGVGILTVAALDARSVALAGFGIDSLIEIGASTVVIWELGGVGEARQQRAMRWIGIAFIALALYLTVQSSVVLANDFHPKHSSLGIWWTAITAAVMFGLAAGKSRVGGALDNPVLQAEGRVTFIDAVLASAVLLGLLLNAVVGWWWADPVAGCALLFYAARVGRIALRPHKDLSAVPPKSR
jgi:hypothetical protein